MRALLLSSLAFLVSLTAAAPLKASIAQDPGHDWWPDPENVKKWLEQDDDDDGGSGS